MKTAWSLFVHGIGACQWVLVAYMFSEIMLTPYDEQSYDFDLRTGQSDTGLKACTYAIELRPAKNDTEEVWLQTPEEGTHWRLVELRPVSEGMNYQYK